MRILVYLFLFVSTMGLSQFSPIWTINSNFSLRAFEINDSGDMMVLTYPYNGGPLSKIMIYTSPDFGNSWDSTYLPNFAMMMDNAFVTEGSKMYIASLQSIYPGGGLPGYQRKVVHSSMDGGANCQKQQLILLIQVQTKNVPLHLSMIVLECTSIKKANL
jgi:hypothetical protein